MASLQEEKEIAPSPLVVFIGGIPSGAQDHQLKAFLEKSFGPIDKVKIIQDKETKKSKGYGFVRFYEESHAQMLKDKGLVTFMNKNLNVGDAFKGERTNPNPVRKDTRKPTSPLAQPALPIGSAALRGELPATAMSPESLVQYANAYYANLYYQMYNPQYLYGLPYNYAAAALAQQQAAPLATAAQWEALQTANTQLPTPGAIRPPAKKAIPTPVKPRGPPTPKATPLPLAPTAASNSASALLAAKSFLSASAPTFVPASASATSRETEYTEPSVTDLDPTPLATSDQFETQ